MILFHLLPFIFVHSVFLVKKDLVIKNESGGQQLVQKKSSHINPHLSDGHMHKHKYALGTMATIMGTFAQQSHSPTRTEPVLAVLT